MLTSVRSYGSCWHSDTAERDECVGAVHNAPSSQPSRAGSDTSAYLSTQSSVAMSIPSAATFNLFTDVSSATNELASTVSSATTHASVSSIYSGHTSTDEYCSRYKLVYNGPNTVRHTRSLYTLPSIESFDTPLVTEEDFQSVRCTVTDVGISPAVDDPLVHHCPGLCLIPLYVAAQQDNIKRRPEQFESQSSEGTSAISSLESAPSKLPLSKQYLIPRDEAIKRRDITHRPEQYETLQNSN